MAGNRTSTFELLRIMAMFMVLGLHVNYLALGYPSRVELLSNPLPIATRVVMEMLTIGAVNLFVLISGWFGIRASAKGLGKFLFHCVFVVTVMYLIGVVMGRASLTSRLVEEGVYFYHAWFVPCYAMLYVLSPVLNAYIERATERQLRGLLMIFYLMQSIYGWLSGNKPAFDEGYSIVSFVGLYMLARYVKLYGSAWWRRGKWLWLVATVSNVALALGGLYFGKGDLSRMAMCYSSPLVVAGALGLVMWCAVQRSFVSSGVNFVASSCFTVYLVHSCNRWTAGFYTSVARDIHGHTSGVLCIAELLLFMVAVFAFAILLDQLRKAAWTLVSTVAVGRVAKLIKS